MNIKERIVRRGTLPTILITLLACAASGPERRELQNIPSGLRAGAVSTDVSPAKILEAHNRYRQERGVAPLQWSPQIAASAQKWANRLAASDSIKHSSSPHGENLWVGSAGAFTQTNIVDSWGSEIELFLVGKKFPKACRGSWSRCGHYTQIIWRNTSRVGCGLARRGGKDYFVCQYDPPGNVRGQKPY